MLAEWLDNDGDGCVDNPTVLDHLLEIKEYEDPPLPKYTAQVAVVIMDDDSQLVDLQNAGIYQWAPLTYNEIFPNCSGPASTQECLDASLEEVLHLITDNGFAEAFPAALGIPLKGTNTSLLTEAMDVARGGKLETPPYVYNEDAWWTYTDESCDYSCQATEYIYQGIAAWVGALVGQGVTEQWRFDTREKLVEGDLLLTAIINVSRQSYTVSQHTLLVVLQDTSTYRLPNVSPTGNYYGPPTCSSGGIPSQGMLNNSSTTNNPITNSTDTSSSSSSTTPSSTTLSPEDRINSANEIISESNEAYTVAAENANTASSAVDSVDTINSALNTSTTTTSGRVRRQSESTTVSPVNGCSDFSTKYKQLLNELGSFSDSNVDLIKQLVTVLNNTLESIPCDEDEKTSLKSETEGDVEAAKSKANEYKAEKEEEMEELVVRIQEALALIEEANQELIDQNRPTIPGFTASFLLPSTNTTPHPDNSTTSTGEYFRIK